MTFRINNPLKVALGYALLGSVWIITSDQIVEFLFPDPKTQLIVQTFKGILYVITTTILVFWLSRQAVKNIERGFKEKRLRTLESLLHTTLGSLREAVLVIESQTGKIIQCNAAAEQMFGYTGKELIGSNTKILHLNQSAYKEFAEMSGPVIERGQVFKGRFRMKRKDGRILETEHTLAPITETLNFEKYVIDTVFDITESVIKDEEINKQDFLLNSVGQAIISTDSKGQISFWNKAAENIFGWLEQEVSGKNVLEIIVPESEKKISFEIFNEIQSGNTVKSELLVNHKEEKPFWVMANLSPVFNTNKKFVGTIGIFDDITERKKVEKELFDSEEKYRLLANNTTDLIWTLNMDLVFTYVNPAVRQLTGFEPEEYIGTHLKKRTSEENFKALTKLIEQELQKGDSYTTVIRETEVLHKNGTMIPIEFSARLIFDDNNIPQAIQGASRNISERKIAEKSLRQSEEKYRTLFSNMLDGFALHEIVLDEKGKPIDYIFLEVNRAFEKLTTLKKEDIIGKRVSEVLPGIITDPADWIGLYGDVTITGKEIHFEQYLKDIEKWFDVVAFRSQKNQFVSTFQDITERKIAEQALHERESRWRTLLDTIPDLVWIKDPKGTYIACNHEFEKLFGAKEEEIIGKTDYDFVSKELADFFLENDKKALDLEGPRINEEEVTFVSDGHKAVLETIKTPVYYANRKLMGVLGIARDITKRKETEQEIRKLSIAIEQSPLLIMITDLLGSIEYVNPKFSEVTGYSKNEVIGKNPRILNSGELPKTHYKELWETIKRGKTWRGEFLNKRKDGEHYWENATINPILSETGEITHFIGLKEDISKTKDLENQLQQSQKLEAIGQLAGGIAHDFNNLLTVINGYSSLVLNDMKGQDKYYKEIEQISKAGERAGLLTNQLLSFSRKQIIRPINVNLNLIISEIRKILKRIIGEDIQIEMFLAEDLKNTIADAGQINQIIMNLAVNARDAMPHGGKLTIETKNEEVNTEFAAMHMDLDPGSYVTMSVKDTGSGMDKKTQGRIFEPFFTTKEMGKGTGLGLSTVYGIVKQHKGNILVSSELNKGTTFRVYLPQIHTEEIIEDSTESDMDFSTGSETILLIEDDESVLNFTSAILSNAGYKVISIMGGNITTKLLNEISEKIDLLVTDVIMKGLNGKEISDYLRKRNKNLKAVFMSGYTDDTISRSGILKEGNDFLQKPFLPVDLLKIVRHILDTHKV